MPSGIYLISNSASGKCYVGSTKNLHKRKIQHFSGLGRKDHKNRHLQNAWDKYGSAAFMFSVLIICEEKNLLMYEQICIDHFDTVKTGYNILPIAGRTVGRKPSSESIEKMARTKRGVPMSPKAKATHAEAMRSDEVRKKISEGLKGTAWPAKTPAHIAAIAEANRGSKRTPEQCKKISAVMTGKTRGPHREETKRKISAAQKGRLQTPAQIEALAEYRAAKRVEIAARDSARKAELALRKTENGGYRHTEETRLKASEARKGKPLSAAHVEAIRKAAALRVERQKAERLTQPPKPKGEFAMDLIDGKWKQSEAFKRKLSADRKGKKFTEEHKEALRIARKKRAERERSAKMEAASV